MYLNEFLPYMEKSVFMGMLDDFVWERVCRDVKEKKFYERKQTVFIKIQEMDFYYSDLSNSLIELVKKHNIDPSLFCLEFDEKSILEKENNLRIVHALKEAGFKIALDNFGSGYSSFYMFEELEPNALKINLKDISGGGDGKKEKVIILSMIKLAEKINTMLIFKSVNSKLDFDILKKMKCKYFQGKYFADEKEENTL